MNPCCRAINTEESICDDCSVNVCRACAGSWDEDGEDTSEGGHHVRIRARCQPCQRAHKLEREEQVLQERRESLERGASMSCYEQLLAMEDAQRWRFEDEE